MSTSLQYAHELLDRMSEEQVRSIVGRMEEIVWNGAGHTDMDIPAIREVVRPIAERHGVKRVYLFGSRARGDNRPDSDYDFLIEPGEVKNLWGMADLLDDLETAYRSHVDVITDGADDKKLLAEAERDAVLLYEYAG